MTKIELLEQIVKKQDELINWFDDGKTEGDAVIRKKIAELWQQLEECDKKDYSHLCCICHENYVDSDNGYDTCDSCMNRI